MDICVPMVHDELDDFATPVKVQYFFDDYVYDNEQYNNEESESDDDEMDYNYDDEYFYWSDGVAKSSILISIIFLITKP